MCVHGMHAHYDRTTLVTFGGDPGPGSCRVFSCSLVLSEPYFELSILIQNGIEKTQSIKF